MSTLLKKVTSLATVLLIALHAISPVSGVMAAYTSLEAANKLAEQGIIVDQSTNPANYRLGDTITRWEMAKVAANLAGIEPNTSCEGKFADVSATNPNNWVCGYVEALLENSMISANSKFRPSDTVSKAEALKMVMSATWVEPTDNSDWRIAYVESAVENGIIDTAFTDYDTKAFRSFVFDNSATAIEVSGWAGEEDPLGGLLGTETGSTTTTDTGSVVNSWSVTPIVQWVWTLQVSLNPASLAQGTQIPTSGSVRFAKVDFTAWSSDASIDTVELKSLGLASVDSSTRIWFEKNGKRLSGKASFSSERTAVTSFAPSLVVKAGATETLDLYVELSAHSGNDFQFTGKVTASSAATVSWDFTTNALRTAEYTVAIAKFKNTWSTWSTNLSSDAVELGKFTIEATKTWSISETRDLTFNSITLKQNGNADVSLLSNLQLERNGTKVSSEIVVSGKDVTFLVNDLVKDWTTATYYVKGKINSVENNDGDTYKFDLRNTSDLGVIENLNWFRASVTADTTQSGLYTVKGADIVFARDSSVDLSKTYSKGSDAVFMQWTITAKQAVTLEDPKITLTVTNGTVLPNIISTLYLQIGSSTMSWSAVWTSTWTITAQFSGIATINSTSAVKLYAKLKDDAPTTDIKAGDMRLDTFTTKEYVANQNTVSSAIWSIPWVQVSVWDNKLSITRIDGLGATKIVAWSKAILTNEVSIAVTQGNDIRISNPVYTVSSTNIGSNSSTSTGVLNNAFATLYVDWVAVSSKTIDSTSIKFDNLAKVITKTTPVKLAVKVDLTDAFASWTLNVQLSWMDAVDNSSSVAISSITYPIAANLTIATANGILSTSDSNPKASLLLAWDRDQKLLAFRVKAENDVVKLRDVIFTGANLNNLTNFRILTPTNEYIAATSVTSTGVKFETLEPTSSIAQDSTATFYVVADVNTNTNATGVILGLELANSKIKSSNWTNISMSWVNVSSNIHAISENTALVAKATNSSKAITTSALRFTVTSRGKDKVTLSWATFANVFWGYTTTWATIKVYKDSVSAGNLVWSGTTWTVSWLVSLTGNSTVDAWSTNTYIVVIEGIVGNSTNTMDWTVSMSDLQMIVNSTTSTVVNTSTYNNMWDMPITETK